MQTSLTDIKRAFWIVRKRKRKKRTDEKVLEVYQNAYSIPNDKFYEIERKKRIDLLHRNKSIVVDGLYFYENATLLVAEWIERFGAKKILEVGSGRGKNLLTLSKDTSLELTGLEKSSEGVKRGREIIPSAFFVCGDARALPFKDKQFDVAFTILVLEQLPHDYKKAVDEMRRVARHGIFVEPFREAQSVADLTWLYYRDKFRSSYKTFNMEPIFFTKDLPHDPKFSVGLYVGGF